jgi:hypothetical protein
LVAWCSSFARDDALLDVVQDVGDVQTDFATICEALTATQNA